MKKFAKLFESEKYGQIVAMLTDNDETGKPQISFYCMPGEPLGICRTCINFEDSEKGERNRDEALSRIDLAVAEGGAAECFKIAEGMRSAQEANHGQ